MSKSIARTAVVAVTLALPVGLAAGPQAASQSAPPTTSASPDALLPIVGKWNVLVSASSGQMEAQLDLRRDAKDASKVVGTIASQMGEAPLEGRFAGGTLNFAFTMDANGSSMNITFTGQLQKDGSLAGTFDFGQGAAPWTATKVPAPSVAGKWTMALDIQGTTATPGLELKIDGEKVTGFYEGRYGRFPVTGTLKGQALQFSFTMNADGTPAAMTFYGDVAADGQSIKGTANMEGMGEVSWSATRAKGD
jgi:hypothetical protein